MANTRIVRFYSFHIHTGETPVNYRDFFNLVGEREGEEIQVSADYVIVLDRVEMSNSETFACTFIGGDPEENRTVFDRESRRAVEDEGDDHRWQGKLTRAYFSFEGDRRILGLESVRSGVTTSLLEKYLLAAGRGKYQRLSVEVTPIPKASFIEEIDRFERIRVASIEVARPNYGFGDIENRLFNLADSSEAQSAEVSVKARRAESLSKHDGLVSDVREAARANNTSIKNASIEGRKPGATRDEKVSLNKHQERITVRLNKSDSVLAQTRDIFSQIFDAVDRIIRS